MINDKNIMTVYTFTLVLDALNEINEEVEETLFESGCDDALLLQKDGTVYLDFDREAPSLKEALKSAIADVERAGYMVHHIEPAEYITMAEAARYFGRSKESIRKLSLGERGNGNFPRPIAGLRTKTKLYQLSDLVSWFEQHEKKYSTIKDDSAVILHSLNLALAFRHKKELYTQSLEWLDELKSL